MPYTKLHEKKLFQNIMLVVLLVLVITLFYAIATIRLGA